MQKILFLLLFLSGSTFAQTVTISGSAPAYVGKDIEIYEIEDYFSNSERLITTGKVGADSTFSIRINSATTRKIAVKGLNNKGYLYVQPNAKYNIIVPEKDEFDPYRPTGNMIELGFIDLDSSDINYKILGFQRWIDRFVGLNFHLRSYDQTLFSERLDGFKTNVEKAYKADTSEFFRTYIRFSIANLDNIEHGGARNRYEKHDFYLKHTPVFYENDAYMSYLGNFYQEMIPRLSETANQAVYMGVLRSSPTEIMQALGSEYTLINLRIREMVMIKALADEYHSSNFPQTNILSILDSVENHSLFKANSIIAKNIKKRLTDLVPGSKAPDFVLTSPEKETQTLYNFRDKYIYFQFIDPNSQESIKELELLEGLHELYGEYVTFVTLYRLNDSLHAQGVTRLTTLPWAVYGLESGNSLWKNYQVEAFPNYILIDATGNVVASPALGPTPNGQYETIDQTFFSIKSVIDEEKREKPTQFDDLNGSGDQ